jgi:hypothetical protein
MAAPSTGGPVTVTTPTRLATHAEVAAALATCKNRALASSRIEQAESASMPRLDRAGAGAVIDRLAKTANVRRHV